MGDFQIISYIRQKHNTIAKKNERYLAGHTPFPAHSCFEFSYSVATVNANCGNHACSVLVRLKMIDDHDYAADIFFEGGLSYKGQPLSGVTR